MADIKKAEVVYAVVMKGTFTNQVTVVKLFKHREDAEEMIKSDPWIYSLEVREVY